jgi:methyl-accepting chemotaxis protein
MLARLSITRQFLLLALLGVILAIAALGISVYSTYTAALEARKAEIKNLVQAAVTTTEGFVAQAQSGKMTPEQAQKAALAALGTARFDNGNYYFVYTYDGTVLQHARKNWIGTNRATAKDPYGTLTTAPMIAAARAGQLIFHEYYQPKANSDTPQPKISYMQAVPEWGWAIGTGVYVDDLERSVLADILRLTEIFAPLLLAFLAIAYLMNRGVSEALAGLTAAIEKISAGQLETSIPGLQRDDQLGRIARRIASFRDDAAAKRRLEAEAQQAQATAEAARTGRDAERATNAAEQTAMAQAVATGLSNLAAGNLTFRLNAPLAVTFEPLRHDFNAAMDRLHEAMRAIAANSSAVRDGTAEITSASDDLARRTEQQAASLEQTAAALTEITATVTAAASNAGQASSVVNTAKDDAEHSGAVLRDTVAAMGGIDQSARQISNIIGVIDEIAFQTNLLALNAGVEAARAGDAGRGFAVVATEVRALAQRSADAAKEIKTLIAASGQQVQTGVRLVDETSKALGRIIAHVATLNTLVAGIAASAQEQSTGLGQVTAAVSQMDQVTQQNAAMVQQSTAACHAMTAQAESLASLMTQFQISAATLPDRQRTPKPRPVSAPPPRAGRPAAPAPKQPEPASADAWDEF